MQKVALFAFNGELMCFVHVLLNALDMKENGMDPTIVFEGASVKLVEQLANESNPFHGLYTQAKEQELIEGACKACSAKLGAVEAVQAEGLPLLDGVKGHPAMREYMEKGYQILTF
ncbi:DsrE family protein [Salidesulfovibrio brasiliensis]|uniref:DsrE family protein n=1 Tax=Salidesulfovibrio brasiliensis TaxID=221711 RepID=UPI0006D0BD3B|nr:DsrE family protein [Salidesulfovibrio brasiliensis]